MASKKPPADPQQASRDFLIEFMNSTGPSTQYPPPRTFKCPPRTGRAVKPTQKIERGQKGIDYAASQKQVLDGELMKKFSRMNLSNVTSLTNHSLDITAATSTSVMSVVTETFGKTHRRDLPIFRIRDQIIQTISECPVTLVSGETGSGKSTQVAQYIYDYQKLNKKECKIAICQPRKIAAITIAQRVAEERGTIVGGEVGYQISLKRVHGEDPECPTGLLFCTTGVLLQQLIFKKSMTPYTHIFLDEVHEREIDTDFLLILLKTLLVENPNVKIVLLSATMDHIKFQDFFKVPLDDGSSFIPPVVDLLAEERQYPVKIHFIEEIINVWPDVKVEKGPPINYNEPGISDNLYEMAASLIQICLRHHAETNENHLNKPPSILVFLPGLQEIESLHSRLTRVTSVQQYDKMKMTPEICVLHSTLSTEEQRNSFVTSANPKIILSTNIAESGVTIPNVSHVIDFCLTKYQKTVPGAHMSSLVVEWASKNNCKQRSGRAGRVCKGSVFRLVEKYFYNKKMPDYPPPEMLRVGLESVVLKIKVLDMGSPLQMLAQAMDPPDMSKVVDAVLHLKELGALTKVDENGKFCYLDGKLTFLGHIIASLPLDPRISKFIVLGYLFSVLDEAIIIGAGLNMKSIFAHAFDRKLDCYVEKLEWSDGSESDCIAILNAYNVWHHNKYFEMKQKTKGERNWCNRHFLDMKNLQDMKLMIDEIKRRLEDHRVRVLEQDQPAWDSRDKIFVLKVILAGAFGAANFFVPPEDLGADQREAYKVVNNKDLFRTVFFKGMNRELIGEVYEEQLRQILKDKGAITETTNLDIEFNNNISEKIFLTFNDEPGANDAFDKKAIGKVMPEVYRCVKLRQLDNRIFLDTMSVQETMKYAGQQGLGVFSNEEFVSFEPHKSFIKHPEWIVEPTLMTTKMHGYVTHVADDGKFFFRPVKAFYETFDESDGRYQHVYEELQEKIGNAEGVVPLKNSKTEVGKLVIVDSQETLERGRLLAMDANRADVYFIDCGKRVNVPIETVFVPTDKKTVDELLEYPPRIFECTLTEVQPSSIHSRDGKWTSEAVKTFRSVIDKKATIRIYSVVDGVASVQLNISKENWNLTLVKAGFAEDAEESYMSKMNHEYRLRSQRQRQSDMPRFPEDVFKDVIDKSKKIRVPSPDVSRCRNKQKLQGPYSPLEMSLRGLSRLNNSSVHVEVSSVNSVLLNENLLKFRETFCVASDVTVNPKNNRVTVRETTMMPSIPGLAVILSLIFSPDAQLRRDEQKFRYLSVITGLGYDAERDQPLYGERDAALNIDFELSQDDLDMINDLRYFMSTMLLTDPNKTYPDLVQRQKADVLKEIQSLTLKIFEKDRRPLEVSQPEVIYNWNVDQEEAVDRVDTHGKRGLFAAINYPELHEMPMKHKMELLQHAEELKGCAKNMIFMQNKVCKLCNFYWELTPELELHLFSKKHINRVEQLSM